MQRDRVLGLIFGRLFDYKHLQVSDLIFAALVCEFAANLAHIPVWLNAVTLSPRRSMLCLY